MVEAVFTSIDAAYSCHNGETVRILRSLSAGEASDPEGSQMYRIRFLDGTEAEAYEEELKKAKKTTARRTVALTAEEAKAIVEAARGWASDAGGVISSGVEPLALLVAVGKIADTFSLTTPRTRAWLDACE